MVRTDPERETQVGSGERRHWRDWGRSKITRSFPAKFRDQKNEGEEGRHRAVMAARHRHLIKAKRHGGKREKVVPTYAFRGLGGVEREVLLSRSSVDRIHSPFVTHKVACNACLGSSSSHTSSAADASLFDSLVFRRDAHVVANGGTLRQTTTNERFVFGPSTYRSRAFCCIGLGEALPFHQGQKGYRMPCPLSIPSQCMTNFVSQRVGPHKTRRSYRRACLPRIRKPLYVGNICFLYNGCFIRNIIL